MKALVTGATGFIGTNLVYTLLRQGHQVFCLARSEKKAEHLQKAGGTIVIDDLRSPQHIDSYIKKVDVVFHIAGVVKASTKEEYFAGNHQTTQNLATSVGRYGPEHQKIIYISSQAAAGPSTRMDFCEANTDARPVSAYGESKRAAEIEILSLSPQRPVVILRPSIVFGPGDRALLYAFRAARWGFIPRPGIRDMPVNFLYVQDLIDAMLLTAEKNEAINKTFFINDGMKYSWDIWNKTVARCLNTKAISLPVAKLVLHAVCQAGGVISKLTGSTNFLNPDKWHEIKQDGWLCSTAKIRDELGFTPRWTLEEGIKVTAKWYREAGWLP